MQALEGYETAGRRLRLNGVLRWLSITRSV
jgi:hypothetical protein